MTENTGNTANARVDVIALDAADTRALAAFYTGLTGWKVGRSDEGWTTLKTGEGYGVALQKAPDHVPAQWPGQEHPQQVHLDLLVDDPEAAAAKAEELGATRLGAGASWITLADPAGHPFDLCQRDGADFGLYAATFDAPDAAGLARFYAALLGLELAYEGPEGALVTPENSFAVMFQQIENYSAPRWPDPAYPQQAHLDVEVDDLDTGQAQALAAGATLLDDSHKGFRVYADPAGHPFCLVE